MAINFSPSVKVPLSAAKVLKYAKPKENNDMLAGISKSNYSSAFHPAQIKLHITIEYPEGGQQELSNVPVKNMAVDYDQYTKTNNVHLSLFGPIPALEAPTPLPSMVQVPENLETNLDPYDAPVTQSTEKGYFPSPLKEMYAEVGKDVLEFEANYWPGGEGMNAKARVERMLNTLYEHNQKDGDIQYLVSAIDSLSQKLETAAILLGPGVVQDDLNEEVARGKQIVSNLGEAMEGRIMHAWLNEGGKTTLCLTKPQNGSNKVTPVMVVIPHSPS